MSLFIITQLLLGLEYIWTYILMVIFLTYGLIHAYWICYRYNNTKQKVTIVCISQIVKQIFQQYILKRLFFWWTEGLKYILDSQKRILIPILGSAHITCTL